MRVALHAIICCCLIAAILPIHVEDAGPDANLKKRIKAWLQNRMKMEPEPQPDAVGVQREETSRPGSPPPSSGLNIRLRRAAAAAAKAPGCFLFACVYHNLLSRLDHFNSKQKVENAPESRMRPSGYGRRRRRWLEDGTEAPLQTDQRHSREALPVCRYNTCTVA